MRYEIELMDAHLAENFCVDRNEKSMPKIRAMDRCYALVDRESSEIAGITIIGSPISTEDQSRFRTQILFTSFVAEAENESAYEALFEGLKSSGSTDLFDPITKELWNNPDVLLYIYKITSTQDDGYYIGRHVLRGKNLTSEDGITDGYWGSGGKRFQKWKDKVGKKSLRKEIISIHNCWESLVNAEFMAIGNLYATDINCKNYVPGGAGGSGYASGLGPLIKQGECIVHGLCAFSGDSCCVCTSQMSLREDVCETHGLTMHRNQSCLSCGKAAGYRQDDCIVHGETTFSKNGCWSCSQSEKYSLKLCEDHGLSKHTGDSCVACFVSSAVEQRECLVHGMTAHSGTNCYKCRLAPTVTVLDCKIHGFTKHKGQSCYKCMSENRHEKLACRAHGLSWHTAKGDAQPYCLACKAEDRDSMKKCSIHGLTLHCASVCYKCNAEKSVSLKNCSIHGEAKHRGDTCQKCVATKKFSQKDCPTHGETFFAGAKCLKCRKSAVTMDNCKTHGITKFRGANCCKCVAASRYSDQECSVHGLTRHSGKSCEKCTKKGSARLS